MLTCCGMVKNAQGKKVQKYFCNSRAIKDDHANHELMGTIVAIVFHEFQFQRGHRLGSCFPDLIMTHPIAPQLEAAIEVDCGTMAKLRVLARWRAHSQCKHDVLVVVACKGDQTRRMHRLMEWSDGIKHLAYFVTLETLEQAGPHARVWDYIGRGVRELKRVKPPVPSSFSGNAQGTL